MKDKYDFGIIGAGVVGLSIARKLLEKKFSVILFEKNDSYGLVSSINNSGVIHSGAYYETNTLKHKLSIKGKELIYEYCKKNNIDFLNTGKLFISLSEENESLEKIYNLSINNGLNDLKFINEKEIKRIDDKILSKEGLFCPSSGIIDKKMFLDSLYNDCLQYKNNFSFIGKTTVDFFDYKNSSYKISDKGKEFNFEYMINCTGIESSIFHKKNIDSNLNLYPNPVVGAYLTLNKKIKLNTIIYTSLVPGSISERVDATPTLHNNIIFGPSIDTDLPDPKSLIDRFSKVISKYIEIDKDNLKYAFYGIRPKAKNDQKKIKDFIFLKDCKNSMSLINIESPGFTSCLAIADYVSEKII